jgi:hypothetical protein
MLMWVSMVSTAMIGKINVSNNFAIIAKFSGLAICVFCAPTGA